MRWSSRAFVLALCLSAACGPTPDDARRELAALEGDLSTLAQTPESEWLTRLDSIKASAIESPEVVAVRDLCVSAYEAFGEATVTLAAARDKVNAAQDVHAAGPDAGFETLLTSKQNAEKAVNDVAEALDNAEALVKRCMDERDALRAALTTGK